MASETTETAEYAALKDAIQTAGVDLDFLVVRSMPFGDLMNDVTKEVFGAVKHPALAYALVRFLKKEFG